MEEKKEKPEKGEMAVKRKTADYNEGEKTCTWRGEGEGKEEVTGKVKGQKESDKGSLPKRKDGS
jgi:hypothetical protein